MIPRIRQPTKVNRYVIGQHVFDIEVCLELFQGSRPLTPRRPLITAYECRWETFGEAVQHLSPSPAHNDLGNLRLEHEDRAGHPARSFEAGSCFKSAQCHQPVAVKEGWN
jgi:hypothetical protein